MWTYEISVSLNGRYYFATAPRSLDGAFEEQVMTMVNDFRRRFPVENGFTVSVSRRTNAAEGLAW